MKKSNYSRKRVNDDCCRSESLSSCYSSSLKSFRNNGYDHCSSYLTKKTSKRLKYSNENSNYQSKQEIYENKRKYEKRDESISPPRKRHRPQNEESDSESEVEKDNDGYLIMKENSIIDRRYKVIKQLGEGTFGRVVHCKDLDSSDESPGVAIKVIRDISKYRDAARLELKVLDLIKKHDPNENNLVITAINSFNYHGHISIIFPLLGPSVFDFLKGNHYNGYPMRQVRYMAYQICKAVDFLHSIGLTHTDLKPENILLVDGAFDLEYNENTKRNVKVLRDVTLRIIDLGSATFEDEHHTSIVATRHYRPLEVVLGLGWSYPCDVWSVGCILFELYTGVTMFMTHDNLEHLAMMERVLGPLPRRMTYHCRKSKYFFSDSGALKWDSDSKAGRYVRSEVKPLRRWITRPHDDKELDLFDLIQEMLEYNPHKRITMHDSVRHPFLLTHYRRDYQSHHRSRRHRYNDSSSSVSQSNSSSSSNSSEYSKRNVGESRRNNSSVKAHNSSHHNHKRHTHRKRRKEFSDSYTPETSRRRQ